MIADMDVRMEAFTKYLDRSKMDHKDYQHEGVKWTLTNELREDPPCGVRGGFIADEMGLGKTILMIGTFVAHLLPHTLIVLPPVLIDQWVLQIKRTTGHDAFVYHGPAKKTCSLDKLRMCPIVITTYGAVSMTKLQLDHDDNSNILHEMKWSRIVFDEAHHLRNKKTTLYQSTKRLKADIRWLVSGTPIQNNKKDFYNLCSILGLPASFYNDRNNLITLARHFILKRTKKQVGIVISDLIIDNNTVNWTNEKEMILSQEIHSDLTFSRVSGSKHGLLMDGFAKCYDKRGRVLAMMMKARQTCVLPKLMLPSLDNLVKKGMLDNYDAYKESFNHSSKLDIVVNTILERKGNDCGKLIFCHYRQEIDEIAKRLRDGGMSKVATFDGRTSHSDRHEILTEKNEALILQIQTGCEGLNLQENYSEIYFVTPHWNPAVEDQAIARCHRIGQTKPVYVKRFEMCQFVKDFDQVMNTQTIDNYATSVQGIKRDIATECLKP